jgi:hypothetical protein
MQRVITALSPNMFSQDQNFTTIPFPYRRLQIRAHRTKTKVTKFQLQIPPFQLITYRPNHQGFDWLVFKIFLTLIFVKSILPQRNPAALTLGGEISLN